MNLESFRLKCHKVLPLVYDDSLSYYEILCKLVKVVNDLSDNEETQNEEIERLAGLIDGYDERITEAEEKVQELQTKVDEEIDRVEAELETINEKFTNPDSFATGKQNNYVLAVDGTTGLKWVDASTLVSFQPETSTPLKASGSGDAGDSDTYSRGDHVHPAELPSAGTTGQVLAKNSDTSGDVRWVDPEGGTVPEDRLVPTGGTTSQVLAKASNEDGDTEWVDPQGGTVPDNRLVPTGGTGTKVLMGDSTSGSVWVTPDSEPVEDSTKPITSGGVYEEVQALDVMIDAVETRVGTAETDIDNLESSVAGKMDTPSGLSTGQVLVKTASGFGGKSVDNTPTTDSTNLITSGAVKNPLDLLQKQISNDAWRSDTNYSVGTLVLHDNKIWVARKESVNQEPDDESTYWEERSITGIMNERKEPELLWTNANPTQEISEKTITFDVKGYNLFIIVFKATTTSTDRNLTIAEGNTGGYIQSSSTGKFVFRWLSITNTGASIGKGYIVNTYGQAGSQNNTLLIPEKIYGI